VLENEKTLAEYGVSEGTSIICMMLKATKSKNEVNIERIMELGCTREVAEATLKTCDNDIDRASNMLLTGIDPHAEKKKRRKKPKGPLDFLNENPVFMRIRSEVAQNPSMLPTYLQRLKNTDEDLYNIIMENHDEFVKLIQKPNVVELTAKEMRAVRRIADLGFEEGAALEAYIMQGRNEEMAAAVLLENASQGFVPKVSIDQGFEFVDPSNPHLGPAISTEEQKVPTE